MKSRWIKNKKIKSEKNSQSVKKKNIYRERGGKGAHALRALNRDGFLHGIAIGDTQSHFINWKPCTRNKFISPTSVLVCIYIFVLVDGLSRTIKLWRKYFITCHRFVWGWRWGGGGVCFCIFCILYFFFLRGRYVPGNDSRTVIMDVRRVALKKRVVTGFFQSVFYLSTSRDRNRFQKGSHYQAKLGTN